MLHGNNSYSIDHMHSVLQQSPINVQHIKEKHRYIH